MFFYKSLSSALFVSFILLASLLLPPIASADQKSSSEKTQAEGGVGLQVVPVATGEVVVIAVLPQSPAAQAKIAPGDLIVAVDGKSLRNSDFEDVTKNRLWGKAGTKVKLTWLRPGAKGKKEAQLVRTPVKNEPEKDLKVKMLVPSNPLPVQGKNP